MSTLDFITLGYIGISVLHTKNPTKPTNEMIEEVVMGTAGAIAGAMLAAFIFGITIPFSNIALALGGIAAVVGLGKISQLKSRFFESNGKHVTFIGGRG